MIAKFPRERERVDFWKVSRFRPFVSVVSGTGGMIVPRETEVLREEIYPNATLSTTNPKQTGLVSNPTLRDERPATDPFNTMQLHQPGDRPLQHYAASFPPPLDSGD